MGTMLDVIGSIVIRGAIMLALINLTIQMNTALYQKTALVILMIIAKRFIIIWRVRHRRRGCTDR